MGLPSASGEGYELEDGFKWDAITFDTYHSTRHFIEDLIDVKLSGDIRQTDFAVTNLTSKTMELTVSYILDEDRGKKERIKPGKKKVITREAHRRMVMYYRFLDS